MATFPNEDTKTNRGARAGKAASGQGTRDKGAMTAQNSFGSQLVPITDGKREYRLPNKRQGFNGVARKNIMDEGVGYNSEEPRTIEK